MLAPEAHNTSNCNLETCSITQELELVSPSTHVHDLPEPVRHINHYKFLPRPPNDDGIFLEWDAVLRNADWKRMSHYQGEHAYMQDDALDMALKMLAHNLDAPAHSIAVSTSFESQICRYKIEDLPTKEQLRRFGHADWIFIPINNDMLNGPAFMDSFKNPANCKREDGEVSPKENLGDHWALVAIDRLHKTIHYIDGWLKGHPVWRELAHAVANDMLQALSEPYDPQWQFVEEVNRPDQWADNNFQRHDEGPCAAYVYYMISTLMRRITMF
ncbi:hypothetical protein E8E11_001204 [Didymella keratinophila]|nr:hypothetical protein E8E11_001204 [Didymella keratinophila]